MEKARKSGEELKSGIVQEAHDEAGKIIKSGHALIEMEKTKTSQELKALAVNMVVAATEKILREKMDPSKDSRMIEESLKSYPA
jgi:F0F1-type ATP synthase membrane subunit b/b'